MATRRFNEQPEESNEPKKSLKYKNYNLTLDDEFIRNLLMSNAVLERLLIKQIKENIKLENLIEERNDPSFYFNKN